MKAISLWQPWATLIAIGAKKIETRGWPTNYRGPLAIHAAKKDTQELWNVAFETEPFRSVLRAAGYLRFLPHGFIVATCMLVDCQMISDSDALAGWGVSPNIWEFTEQECAFGDYTPGRFAWLLADIKPLTPPVPAKGVQGLWNWEPVTA